MKLLYKMYILLALKSSIIIFQLYPTEGADLTRFPYNAKKVTKKICNSGDQISLYECINNSQKVNKNILASTDVELVSAQYLPGETFQYHGDLKVKTVNHQLDFSIPSISKYIDPYFFITIECDVAYSDSWYFINEEYVDLDELITHTNFSKYAIVPTEANCSDTKYSQSSIYNKLEALNTATKKRVFILEEPISLQRNYNSCDYSFSHSRTNDYGISKIYSWLQSWSTSYRPTIEILSINITSSGAHSFKPIIKQNENQYIIPSMNGINQTKIYKRIDASGTTGWDNTHVLQVESSKSCSLYSSSQTTSRTPLTGLCGRLHFIPSEACEEAHIPKINTTNYKNETIIALVKRGKCAFETKALHIQNLGYAGLVIYNNNQDENKIIMNEDNQHETISIPVVMIDYTPGKLLAQLLKSSSSKQSEFFSIEIMVHIYFRQAPVHIACLNPLKQFTEIGDIWDDIVNVIIAQSKYFEYLLHLHKKLDTLEKSYQMVSIAEQALYWGATVIDIPEPSLGSKDKNLTVVCNSKGTSQPTEWTRNRQNNHQSRHHRNNDDDQNNNNLNNFNSSVIAREKYHVTAYDSFFMYFETKCIHGWDHSCPRWDKLLSIYACHLNTSAPGLLCDSSFPVIELMRTVTSYSRAHTGLIDISPFLFYFSELRARFHSLENIKIHLDGSAVFKFTIRFYLRPVSKHDLSAASETPGKTPMYGEKLWSSTDGLTATYNQRQHVYQPYVPKDTHLVTIAGYITGHGWGVELANCAEFCQQSHHFQLQCSNDTERSHHQMKLTLSANFNEAGTDLGCVSQILSAGVTPNQYGTWYFGRGGWCPGQVIPLLAWSMRVNESSVQDSTAAGAAAGLLSKRWERKNQQYQMRGESHKNTVLYYPGKNMSVPLFRDRRIRLSYYTLVNGVPYVPTRSVWDQGGFSALIFRNLWFVTYGSVPGTPTDCWGEYESISGHLSITFNLSDSSASSVENSNQIKAQREWVIIQIFSCETSADALSIQRSSCCQFISEELKIIKMNQANLSNSIRFPTNLNPNLEWVRVEVHQVNGAGAGPPCITVIEMPYRYEWIGRKRHVFLILVGLALLFIATTAIIFGLYLVNSSSKILKESTSARTDSEHGIDMFHNQVSLPLDSHNSITVSPVILFEGGEDFNPLHEQFHENPIGAGFASSTAGKELVSDDDDVLKETGTSLDTSVRGYSGLPTNLT